MGLSDNLLEHPGLIPSALRCSICTDVFDRPVFWAGRPCQHTFCWLCIEQALVRNHSCPTCRAHLVHSEAVPNMAFEALIDEIRVRCTHDACGWVGRKDLLQGHIENCPVRQVEQLRVENDQLRADEARNTSNMAVMWERCEQKACRVRDLEDRLLEMERSHASHAQETCNLRETLQEKERALETLRQQFSTDSSLLERLDKFMIKERQVCNDSASSSLSIVPALGHALNSNRPTRSADPWSHDAWRPTTSEDPWSDVAWRHASLNRDVGHDADDDDDDDARSPDPWREGAADDAWVADSWGEATREAASDWTVATWTAASSWRQSDGASVGNAWGDAWGHAWSAAWTESVRTMTGTDDTESVDPWSDLHDDVFIERPVRDLQEM